MQNGTPLERKLTNYLAFTIAFIVLSSCGLKLPCCVSRLLVTCATSWESVFEALAQGRNNEYLQLTDVIYPGIDRIVQM